MKSCTLSEDALLKVLLHAAKHPTTAVNGVLLGTVSSATVDGNMAPPRSHHRLTSLLLLPLPLPLL